VAQAKEKLRAGERSSGDSRSMHGCVGLEPGVSVRWRFAIWKF
jgi:hypothetical protein